MAGERGGWGGGGGGLGRGGGVVAFPGGGVGIWEGQAEADGGGLGGLGGGGGGGAGAASDGASGEVACGVAEEVCVEERLRECALADPHVPEDPTEDGAGAAPAYDRDGGDASLVDADEGADEYGDR